MLKAGHLVGAIRWKVDLDHDVALQEIAMADANPVVLDTQGAVDLSDFFTLFQQQIAPANVDYIDLTNFETVVNSMPSHTAMIWIGWQDFVKNAPSDASVVADLFDSAATAWPGVVLIVGKSGSFPDVGELTSIS